MTTTLAITAPSKVLVWTARARQALGWPGIAGLVLVVGASVYLATAGRAVLQLKEQSRTAGESVARKPSTADLLASERSPPFVNAAGPREVTQVLETVQRIVQDYDLQWSGAELAMQPGTNASPTRLEIRIVLKGTYLRIRHALMRLRSDVAGLTVRDLAMTRASSDTPELEAKIVLGVFLSTGAQSPSKTP